MEDGVTPLEKYMIVEARKREHLRTLLVDLANLGQTLPPGEYTVDELLHKIAVAKMRKSAMSCGPTEKRRGE